jgi:hypothetical protein
MSLNGYDESYRSLTDKEELYERRRLYVEMSKVRHVQHVPDRLPVLSLAYTRDHFVYNVPLHVCPHKSCGLRTDSAMAMALHVSYCAKT